jgi:cytochrome bd ubiquinol oxidase subunit I
VGENVGAGHGHAAFSWVMGLMGYIRSSGRLAWHVNELMPDASPWAYTPTIGFAAKMVTVNMVVFWLLALFLFWLSSRDQRSLPEMDVAVEKQPLFPTTSQEAQPS